jgi:hypothetical protein
MFPEKYFVIVLNNKTLKLIEGCLTIDMIKF